MLFFIRCIGADFHKLEADLQVDGPKSNSVAMSKPTSTPSPNSGRGSNARRAVCTSRYSLVLFSIQRCRKPSSHTLIAVAKVIASSHPTAKPSSKNTLMVRDVSSGALFIFMYTAVQYAISRALQALRTRHLPTAFSLYRPKRCHGRSLTCCFGLRPPNQVGNKPYS